MGSVANKQDIIPSNYNFSNIMTRRMRPILANLLLLYMSVLSRIQGLFKRYEVDQATKLLEEMEPFMKEQKEVFRDICKRMEELGRQIVDSGKDILSLKCQLEEGTTVSVSNLKKSKTIVDQQKTRKGIRKLWGRNKLLHV